MTHATTVLLTQITILLLSVDALWASQQGHSKHVVIPGVRIGEYVIGMSKEDVLTKLGEPEAIHLAEGKVVRRGEEEYTLDNLPEQCALAFSGFLFLITNESVQAIFVGNPRYRLSSGLGVGDSEQKVKQAYGQSFTSAEAFGRELLCYDAEGLGFHIHKKNRIIAEIAVYRSEEDEDGNDLREQEEELRRAARLRADRRSGKELAARIREAAVEGHLAFKLTTPDEFKAIVGQPTNEWKENEGNVVSMEYPGIEVRFFGIRRFDARHTLLDVRYEGEHIDVGRGRPVVLRNENDLDKFGSFWGYCAVDLSRLDLSQKGDLLEGMPFDNLTLWPKSGLLPAGFDPKRRLEWGKNPGLGVRSLHQEGINGSGVGIAIIDKPLLRGHIEYADRIKSYHAIEVEGVDIDFHGSGVCSIAVGKTCGVAPLANLHYYATPSPKWQDDNRPWAKTVEQILERNRDLPQAEKVRVISKSAGQFSVREYYRQWQAVVDEANRRGVLVVTCGSESVSYGTLKRKVGTDPDDPNCHGYAFQNADGSRPVYVPVANRAVASHRGRKAYTFDTRGGDSWAVPYLAGLAVLAFQVHPTISPDEIVKLWDETATSTRLGPVVNPRGFIEAVKGLVLAKTVDE